MLNPLTPYLRSMKIGLAMGLLLGAYFMGQHHARTACKSREASATVAAQSQAISMAGIADAAAAQREQAKIIQQAALAGARKAIAEVPHDACIDSAAPAGVLDGLRPQDRAARPE